MFESSDLNIVHVFDDEKFINHAIEIFEYLNLDSSHYYVIVEEGFTEYRHVKSKLVKPLALNSESSYLGFAKSINETSGRTVVLVHALSYRKQKIVNLLNEDVLKVWFIWGYDLYNMWKPLKYKVLDSSTSKHVNKKIPLKTKIVNTIFFKYNFHLLFKGLSKIYKGAYYKAVQKMDIAVPVLPTEKKYIGSINNKLTYAPFTYGSLELLLGNLVSKNALDSKNILVGNSATPTNNHIEVFNKLSKFDLGDRKVIVPLNYGDRGDYLNFVLEQGKLLFGENFFPILDFMPLEEYNKLILSCNIAFFNHIRQQAVGNIIIMYYFGAKLFFNDEGVTYGYYESEQFMVRSLKELNQSHLEKGITQSEYKNNKEQCERLYSQKAVQDKVSKLFQTIVSHPKLND